METAPKLKITEVSFAKNEGRFFLEWIAYHRLIGVTDFLIYTNDCEDESPALLDRMQDMGLVVHVPNPLGPDVKPQRRALWRASSHPLVTNADWVVQIDPDEFLVIMTGEGHIADLIAIAPEADGICVQMRHFGNNGMKTLPKGLVIENFTGASLDDIYRNGVVKTVTRNLPVFSQVAVNHTPNWNPKQRPVPRLFNAGGEEIPPESYEHTRFRNIPDAHRNMKYAQVNHYAVKTWDYFCAKTYRGTALNKTNKLGMEYWNERNRNEVQDLKIQPWVPKVKAQMEEWLKDPVLAACNRRCFEAYDEILKKASDMYAFEHAG